MQSEIVSFPRGLTILYRVNQMFPCSSPAASQRVSSLNAHGCNRSTWAQDNGFSCGPPTVFIGRAVGFKLDLLHLTQATTLVDGKSQPCRESRGIKQQQDVMSSGFGCALKILANRHSANILLICFSCMLLQVNRALTELMMSPGLNKHSRLFFSPQAAAWLVRESEVTFAWMRACVLRKMTNSPHVYEISIQGIQSPKKN